jgi:hypothetical protein
LFINPELDTRPYRHFLYLPNGKVKGRTDEGKAMVFFYKMNARAKVRDRKRVIDGYVRDIAKAIHRFYKSNDPNKNIKLEGGLEIVYSNIKEKSKKNKELSLLHFFIGRYFEVFISQRFPIMWRNALEKSFKRYNSN